MFNLLPSESKIAIRKEFKLRLAVLSTLALLITLLIAIILLIPSYLFSKAIEKEVLANKGIVEHSLRVQENETLKVDLAQARETLGVLSPSNAPSTSFVLDKITALKGKGISITKLEFTALADRTKQVQISGLASQRDTLLSFKKKLSESKLFSEINLPVSNFADQEDIEFSMNLRGNF